MIYFIQDGPLGGVKIGTTKRLSQRLKQLEKKIGHPLEVLGVMDGSYAEESALHRMFSPFWMESEWFAICPSLLDFIAANSRPWNGEDECPQQIAFRIDSEVLRIARIVASYEEKSLADYISDTLRPIVNRDHARHIKKHLGKGDAPADR